MIGFIVIGMVLLMAIVIYSALTVSKRTEDAFYNQMKNDIEE